MKNILKIIGIFLLGLFLVSCGGKQENGKSGNSEGKQKVKVGTEGAFAPFTFTDESGKLTGYDVEVVEEIGKRANLDKVTEQAYNIAKERNLINIGKKYKEYYEYILNKENK